MRIVVIQRGSKKPYLTHTYFIDEQETIETLSKLIKIIQNQESTIKHKERKT